MNREATLECRVQELERELCRTLKRLNEIEVKWNDVSALAQMLGYDGEDTVARFLHAQILNREEARK